MAHLARRHAHEPAVGRDLEHRVEHLGAHPAVDPVAQRAGGRAGGERMLLVEADQVRERAGHQPLEPLGAHEVGVAPHLEALERAALLRSSATPARGSPSAAATSADVIGTPRDASRPVAAPLRSCAASASSSSRS